MIKDGKTTEEITDIILDGIPHNIVENRKCAYKCDCSAERVSRALVSIGKKDLIELIEDERPTEVECHFCDKKYILSIDELKRLKAERRNSYDE